MEGAPRFDGDGELLDAEAQMAEHEAGLFMDLIEETNARIPGETKVFEVPLVILDLIEEDPEIHEAFERLAILQYFRNR
jgi:hypothetical protein